MDFAEIVRRKREVSFKTPKEFHRKADLSVSYQSYIDIEKGNTQPKIDIALEIVRKLGIPEREALLAWARGHMPDDESRSVFTEAQGEVGPNQGDFARSGGTTLSGAQVKYLVGDGLHVDILRYLSSRLDVGGAAARDLAKAFSVEQRRMTKILIGLEEQGLVEKTAEDTFRVKSHFTLPDTVEASVIRHSLFERAGKALGESKGEKTFRAVLTRRLSGPQLEDLRARLTSFLAAADALPNPKPDEAVYTIGVFAIPQLWRSQ
jgi:DNA-binding XRE family transcriptional regulator